MKRIEIGNRADPIPFLLKGEPWTRFKTLTGLLGRLEHDPEVRTAWEELHKHPLIRDLLSRLDIWFETSVTRHNDPKLPPHILKVLADLGVRAEDPGMREIVNRVEARREGSLFSVRQTPPDKGNGKADPQANEWYALLGSPLPFLPPYPPETTGTIFRTSPSQTRSASFTGHPFLKIQTFNLPSLSLKIRRPVSEVSDKARSRTPPAVKEEGSTTSSSFFSAAEDKYDRNRT